MSRIELKVDGDDVAANKMLDIARLQLRILKGIEQEICKEKGTKPSIRWRVDILSGFTHGLIALRAEQSTRQDALIEEMWAVVMDRLKVHAAEVVKEDDALRLHKGSLVFRGS